MSAAMIISSRPEFHRTLANLHGERLRAATRLQLHAIRAGFFADRFDAVFDHTGVAVDELRLREYSDVRPIGRRGGDAGCFAARMIKGRRKRPEPPRGLTSSVSLLTEKSQRTPASAGTAFAAICL